jgi:hypothetical protein
MGVFKEEVIALEELMHQQKRIYNDACDQGVTATPEVKKTMRWVLESLLPLKESRVVWKMDSKDVTQRQYELTVYFSMEDGVTFDVLYFKDKKKEYFSISEKRAPSLVAS